MKDFLSNYPPVLTVQDVADILSVTPRTVRSLIKSGKLKCIKLSDKLVRIPKANLIEFLNKG